MDEKTKKSGKSGVLRLPVEMMRGYKRHMVLALFGMLMAMLAQYALPLVSSFLIDYVLAGEKFDLPKFLMDYIESIGGRSFFTEHFYVLPLVLLLITVFNGVFVFIRGRFVSAASEGMAKNMRDKLYTHLQSVPYDYHKHVSTGDLVQRCTSDVDTIRRFVSMQLLEIVRTLLMAAIAGTIMFSMNTTMALVSVALLPVMLIISFLYFRYVQKQFTLADEAEGALSATLQENLTGMRVVRAFAQQKSEVEKFTEKNRDYFDKNYKLLRMLGIYWGGTDMLGYSQILLPLVVGIYLVVTTDFTLGQLLIFTSYTAMLTWPVRQLGRVLADMGKASVSIKRLNEILDVEPENEPGAALTPEIKGDIEFKNVCFGYDRFDDVLKDISFKVKRGQTVAILGSTGSGKTSLVQLLQRLYTVTGGSIEIDGVNINDYQCGYLRKNIGIVLQEPFLFSRTIMENIRITKPDAPDEEVYNAARTASLHDVIMSFENGYDTVVGERGVTLSGGQKQRVAIARTLMQNAPILIFDDSLSAVDTETDMAIRRSLSKTRGSATTFIISHRITTLCEADKILVLDHGRLVQEGTHDELIREEGLYKRIAAIQNMLGDELKEGSEDE